jgi:hypothetical protein
MSLSPSKASWFAVITAIQRRIREQLLLFNLHSSLMCHYKVFPGAFLFIYSNYISKFDRTQKKRHVDIEIRKRDIAQSFKLPEKHGYPGPDSRKCQGTTAELGRSLHNTSSLCSSCSNLELETIFDNPQLVRRRTGKRLATFQLLPTTAGNGCGLCTIVSAIQAASNKTQSAPIDTFDLFAFSSRRTYRYSFTPLSS